jgi:hypothetical protein
MPSGVSATVAVAPGTVVGQLAPRGAGAAGGAEGTAAIAEGAAEGVGWADAAPCAGLEPSPLQAAQSTAATTSAILEAPWMA